MRVTAAVTREKSQPFTLEQLELDSPREDEVLVRLTGSGVCHTDLAVRDQYYPTPLPAVLGHEGAGVVEQVGGRVTKLKPGDHVALSFFTCGSCVNCKAGQLGYCRSFFKSNYGGARADGSTTFRKNGEVIHGNFFNQSSFATHALASERNAVKVRDDVPLSILGPLGCGVQTGAGAVMNSLAPHAGSSIAVFGTGAVGLSAIMAAKVVGCTTIVGIDVRPGRLELARALGATDVIDGSTTNPVKEIRQKLGPGVSYSLDTTGQPSVLRQAVDCLTPIGVCGLLGMAPLKTEVNLDMNNLFGRSLRGITEGDSIPDVFVPRLIDLYVRGSFPFDKLIKFYKFEDINDAARDSESGVTVKPVLTFA